MTPVPTCAICGNQPNNTIHIAREMMFGLRDAFRYLECAACGCVQLLDVPSDMSRDLSEDLLLVRRGSGRQGDDQAGVGLTGARALEPCWLGRHPVARSLQRHGCGPSRMHPRPRRDSRRWLRLRTTDPGHEAPGVPASHRRGSVRGCRSPVRRRRERPATFGRRRARRIRRGHAAPLVRAHAGSGETDARSRQAAQARRKGPAQNPHCGLVRVATLRSELDGARSASAPLPSLSGEHRTTCQPGWSPRDRTDYEGNASQFLGSEQIKQDIPLEDPRSVYSRGIRRWYGWWQARQLRPRIEELNRTGQGDWACFELRPVPQSFRQTATA